MGLEYKTSARRRWGSQAEISGNAPWALVSTCGRTLVFLYPTPELRDIAHEGWKNCECGRHPCFGDRQHYRITKPLEGLPKGFGE